jgi:integrase
MLRGLARGADLSDPEAVKAVIARFDVSEGRKENLVCAYAGFCRQYGIAFEPPRYRRIQKLPSIPLESEVDQLIAGVGSKTSAYLQLLKETGMRAGEAWQLRWIDLDFEGLTVNVAPEKHSLPRQIKITARLLSMLSGLPKNGECIFGEGKLDDFARWFYMKRQMIAEKLGNPRIRRIGFKKVRPLDIGFMLLWIFLPFSLGYSLLAACLACISRTLSLLGLDDN